jgi:hypothetical protein
VFNPDGSDLLYSTLAGGSGNDHVEAIRLHGETAVMAGWTTSPDFDTPAGGYDTGLNGLFDALALSLTPGDSALGFWTYLGGTADGITGDRALGLDVDAAGRVYLVGSTYAEDFPVTAGAFDMSFDASCLCAEGFAAALSADGADLLWATFLGGDGEDSADAVHLDAAGDLILAGATGSTNFPVSPDAFDGSLGGDSDAFVARLSASGAALPYATYLGGEMDEAGNGVWVTFPGRIAVTGWSTSPDFPTTPGSYDPAHNFDKDVFVTVMVLPGADALAEVFLPIVVRK